MSQSTEEQLIEISIQIGSIAEKNSHYTNGLALRLSTLDRPLDQLTVTELIKHINKYTAIFNAVSGGAL